MPLLLAASHGSHHSFALSLYREIRLQPGNLVFAPVGVESALIVAESHHGPGKEVRNALAGGEGAAPADVVNVAVQWPWNTDPARINDWVKRVTNGRIARLLAAGASARPDHGRMVTVASYLKATWETPFDPNRSQSMPFYLRDGHTVAVWTMQDLRAERYAELNDVQLLELPFERKGMSMLLVLPRNRNGLPAIESSLTPARFAGWIGSLSELTRVRLRLPQFHSASSVSLALPLQKLGVRRLFDPRAKDHVSTLVQQARIDVDERGVEAAAGTYAEISATIPPVPHPDFFVDHPFLFLICSGDQILFMGRVEDPRK